MESNHSAVVPPEALDDLIGALTRRGFRVVGPTVRDGAIVYDEIDSAARPARSAWTDEQERGHATGSSARDDEALFGYAVGPHSWKRFLFPPRVHALARAGRRTAAATIEEEPLDETPLAFIGVALVRAARDRDPGPRLLGGTYRRPRLRGAPRGRVRRRGELRRAGGTCFCVSMDTGPRRERGYDLALTELLDGGHRFLVEVGSERGAEVLAELAAPAGGRTPTSRRRAASSDGRGRPDGPRRSTPTRPPRAARRQPRAPALGRGRRRAASPARTARWSARPASAPRSRTTTDLTGAEAERARASGTRASRSTTRTSTAAASAPSARSRYRQWLTHKLGTWIDQFGTSGCVGCGRCITWCPVGIDITEEVAAIRATGGERGRMKHA